MSKTRLFEWHRRFKEGREEVEDNHRSRRPSTSRTDENVERVRQKVWSDCRLTVRMIADELGMNSDRVWRIITEDPRMRKICAKMEQSLLNEGQKQWRVQVCQDILEQLETEPNLLKRVVTGDESWIFEYDPLTIWQSLEWKSALSSRPKTARMFKSKTKVMLIAFFLMSMELSTQNSCHKAKLLISTSTALCEREENCGKRGHGCFIMTML